MELSPEAQQRLKQARETSGLSQSQAATAIGKTKVSIARWECGDRSPRENDLQRLSELYQVDFQWIIEEIGDAPSPTLARKRQALAAVREMRPVASNGLHSLEHTMELNSEARQRLMQAREACGLSQSQAATAIGMVMMSVARWETGEGSPQKEDLQHLSELYQVEFNWITDGLGDAPSPTVARKQRSYAAFKRKRILESPLLMDVPDTASEEFKAKARQSAFGTSIVRLPRPFGKEILALIEAEEKTEAASPEASAQAIESLARQFNYLLSLRAIPPTLSGTSPEVIKAITEGQVVPTMQLRKELCAALGVDEARLMSGNSTQSPG